MKKAKLKTMVENNIGKYKYIAIRGVDEKFKIGESLDTSYDWDPENDISTYETDNPIELGGVCCINMTHDDFYHEWIETEEDMDQMLDWMMERVEFMVNGYSYRHFGIVVSNNHNPLNFHENDEHEIILGDAKVIATI